MLTVRWCVCACNCFVGWFAVCSFRIRCVTRTHTHTAYKRIYRHQYTRTETQTPIIHLHRSTTTTSLFLATFQWIHRIILHPRATIVFLRLRRLNLFIMHACKQRLRRAQQISGRVLVWERCKCLCGARLRSRRTFGFEAHNERRYNQMNVHTVN